MAALKFTLVFVVAPLACVAAGLVFEAVLSCIASSLRSTWLDMRRLYSRRKDNQ